MNYIDVKDESITNLPQEIGKEGEEVTKSNSEQAEEGTIEIELSKHKTYISIITGNVKSSLRTKRNARQTKPLQNSTRANEKRYEYVKMFKISREVLMIILTC